MAKPEGPQQKRQKSIHHTFANIQRKVSDQKLILPLHYCIVSTQWK